MNPFNMPLSDSVEIREVGAPVSAGSAIDNNSDRVDMAGYEGVIFVAPIEDSAATGVATLTVEQNSDDSDSGMAALAGAVATATCTVNDDLNGQLLVVDVFGPKERYVQAVRGSSTANIAFGTVTAILYGKRKSPGTDHATVADRATAASPAES
ncbi:hypothetical protein LNKW23_18040 [Paralimibaculum aggregatum]|uniref:Uncharacterized protein n=1 Tax=Paralimibaculum aggregatum TaxID=3036245 RepID=A0ABQ6LH21_9RHOB|nr:hypothetical protein [Limibaculum sp. NKW23]GMG82591.1 hypothetical protein LNKW23_18040 [Limibaculum sp. NKW23]